MKKALAGLIVVLYSVTVSHAAALGAAFTYQGRLTDGGNPAAGAYDLRFTIYDSQTGGNPVANSITNSTVGVSNGLFNTELDFGAHVFIGEARWLEIGVRSGGSTNEFTVLDPRQALAPTPYALYAPAAGTAAAATTVVSGGVVNSSLAPNSVTSEKIADATITSNDLAPAILNALFWRLNGNAGTTPGTHFIGTTDDQPLELHVNGVRAMRIAPGGTNDTPNIIGGSSANFVATGVSGATIVGGGTTNWFGDTLPNRINADFATIGGGVGNSVNGEGLTYAGAFIGGGFNNTITNSPNSVIGGGYNNSINDTGNATIDGGSGNRIEPSAPAATIGGGSNNRIGTNGWWATISGGAQNTILPGATYSTIGGGVQNSLGGPLVSATIGGGAYNRIDSNAWHATISGGRSNTILSLAHAATIPGGSNNVVRGAYSFAAGHSANADHPGSFVWADSADVIFASGATNQFAVRAGGGVRFETSGAGMTLDGQAVLSGTVTATQLADNSVGSSKIIDGTVSNIDISDTAAISPSKIADGAGSGLDADLLDGLDSSVFAAAAHNHDAIYWRLSGNSATTPGTHFLGTTDNQPFELRVNSHRGLRLEPGGSNSVNVIGGWAGNGVAPGTVGATVAGGGAGDWSGSAYSNRVEANFATVSGGGGNTIQTNAFYAVIAGGQFNAIQTAALYATISGGWTNTIQDYATHATVGGGSANTIQLSADYATIPGGRSNSATNYAFAAGNRAKASYTGAFVWADASDFDFPSTATNEFAVRATGGVRFVSGIDGNGAPVAGVSLPAGSGSWSSLSDRNTKTDFTPVNPRDFLERVAQLPVQSWRYKTEAESIRHVGPMAQDFHAAFGLGADDKHIATVDAHGVVLAAIQGLNEKLEQTVREKDAEIQALKKQLAGLEKYGGEREARLARLEKAVEAWNERRALAVTSRTAD